MSDDMHTARGNRSPVKSPGYEIACLWDPGEKLVITQSSKRASRFFRSLFCLNARRARGCLWGEVVSRASCNLRPRPAFVGVDGHSILASLLRAKRRTSAGEGSLRAVGLGTLLAAVFVAWAVFPRVWS